MERLLEVDTRRRVVLGTLGRREHTRYLAEDHDDGTIVLTPAVVMTERQARFLADPDRAALLERAMTRRPELVDMTDEFEAMAAEVLDEPRTEPPPPVKRRRRSPR